MPVVAITAMTAFLWLGTANMASGAEILKVVDTDVAIPGGVGNFTGFASVSVDGNKVAFVRSDGASTPPQGIYVAEGGNLQIVADTSMAVPGGIGNFAEFSQVSVDGDRIVFTGNHGAPTSLSGIYVAEGGGLNPVVDISTQDPEGTGNFVLLREISASGGGIAFTGSIFVPGDSAISKSGVYLADASGLRVVADSNSLIPGGTGTFSDGFFLIPSMDGSRIAFFAHGITPSDPLLPAVYVADEGGLQVVANGSTPVPNSSGTFGSVLGSNSVDGARVVFWACESAQLGPCGIYASEAGSVPVVVVDTNTKIPDRQANFSGNFIGFSADDGRTAFTNNSIVEGIYVESAGEITKIIDHTEKVSGKVVRGFLIFPESLSGSVLAFVVIFMDGSEGIYRTDLDAAIPSQSNLILPIILQLLLLE